MQVREQKGLAIAAHSNITPQGHLYIVPSQQSSRQYTVDLNAQTCTCLDYETHRQKCKHIYAVEYSRLHEEGYQLPEVERVRKPTYKQAWSGFAQKVPVWSDFLCNSQFCTKSLFGVESLVVFRLMIEALFSWAIPILIGIGFGVVAMDDYKLAKACFLISALIAEAKIFMWGIETARGDGFRLLICFVAFGLIGALAVESFRYVDRKRASRLKTPQTTQETRTEPTPSLTPQLSESQQARIEFRNETSKALRDLSLYVKLKRAYSIQELGHFRILFAIAGDDTIPEFFLGCQDLYQPNPTMDTQTIWFGIRYTVRYRASKKSSTYVAIPAYTKAPKYTGVLSASQSVDTLGFRIDVYNQIPSYKTLEDLNRKVLLIYVTAPLIDKISEISFIVNNYELISAKADSILFTTDKPSVNWFMSLSKTEKAIQWRGVFAKPTEEIAKMLGAIEVKVMWSLDFALITPKKLPEPDYNP